MKIAVIGGSGIGALLAAHDAKARHLPDTPFGKPSGEILEADWDGTPVFLLARHGPGHVFGPAEVPYRANIYALKTLGVTHLLATGAVGSLREEIRPRDVVVIDQFIDRTSRRASSFFDRAAVHVEFAEPTCTILRKMLVEAGGGQDEFKVHPRGTYVCMEGPAFSTRAESLMHRLWGGDAVGMTALPEAKLAREAEMAYAHVALATDYDCWKVRPADAGSSDPAVAGATPKELIAEILTNLKLASGNALSLIRKSLTLMAGREAELMTSPALTALKPGIWSEKSVIPAEEVSRLAALWGRYFEGR